MPLDPPSRRHRLGQLALILTLVAGLVSAGVYAEEQMRRFYAVALPAAVHVDVARLFLYSPPLSITIGGQGIAAPWTTTAEALRASATLWQRMHLVDWNGVPRDVREAGLDTMLARYRCVLMQPSTWDAMTAEDWDEIPQPIRTVAYRQMIRYWAGFYDVGAAYSLPPGLVANTLAAIVMSESWFDHRAVGVNRDGTSDIGLGGASEFARGRLRLLHAADLVDAGPEDEDYFNPWTSTRVVAMWLNLMIGETRGDLDRAIGAYNRGIAGADDSIGLAYLAAVRRRRSVFIRNQGAPIAWDHVWRRGREIEREAWPWLPPAAAPGPEQGPPIDLKSMGRR